MAAFLGEDLSEHILGIIGMGNIGKKLLIELVHLI